MNFVQQLEECLRDLAAEARKKHPGVKEASERATLRLRTLKNAYVSAVRKASNTGGEHPTSALFRSSDLLHPFLLAANYPNASSRLLEISFRAMRLLMEADAIVPTDGIHLVRVWMIQAQVVVSYYQKLYAKEIKSAEAVGATEPVAAPSASSSWFSWGSSSTTTTASETPSKPVKNAVSSSTGQTGQASQSPKEMEKLALDILSCLLQLLELLRDFPEHLTTELWTNSVALGCLWLHYLPSRHTVQQAAHSTVSQVLSLLFQTSDYHPKLVEQTWEDLLALSMGDQSKKGLTLVGAFSLCRKSATSGSNTAAVPPSSEFALELMTQLWKEKQPELSSKPISQTMSVTMTLLQQSARASVEKNLRTVQWTTVLLQTQSSSYPNECRELLLQLGKQISRATEACRKHPDFEDGYVYSREESIATASTTGEGTGSPKDQKRRSSTNSPLASFFPMSQLWKAGLALEATYYILEKDPKELKCLLEDPSTLSTLAETMSDFATIGASCKDHMLQLVLFCDDQTTSGASLKPTLFRKAEHAVASGNSAMFGEETTSKASEKKSGVTTVPILGETLWVSFQNILRIPEALRSFQRIESLVEEAFAPTLAVLQHFLKRFVGSDELIHLALRGYSTLADICLPLNESSMQRKALLSSLCKLSLPSWGKHDSSSQLQNHHVNSLICLLRIVHIHHDFMLSEWEIVLWTLEELSVLAIASPLLSESSYHGALAVSATFGRLAAFSTCLSKNSLLRMTEALAEIVESVMENRDVLGDSDTVLPERALPSEPSQRGSLEEKRTISEKLVSIGVSAIYGTSDGVGKSDTVVSVADRSKNTYYEEYRRSFVARIGSSKSSVRLSSIGRLPFALTLLADAYMANTFRYKECGEDMSGQLSKLAASSPPIRPFAMDIAAMLTMSHISDENRSPAPFRGPGKLIFEHPTQSQLLAVEPSEPANDDRSAETISQSELLAPLCLSIRSTEKAEVAEAALGALNSILEGSGHRLHGEVWSILISAITSLSGDPSYEKDRSSPEWSKCCLSAFRCLKLIVNDFLDQLSSAEDEAANIRSSLLDCCSSFGGSRHDLNTSLTAIGLLWTIADQDAGTNSIDRALSKLALLSSDSRPEVRNASVNTLFSCIVGRGAGFSPFQWETCVCKTVFDVYELVNEKATSGDDSNGSSNDEESSRYQVNFHHTRDSSSKQWITTQVLVLRGIIRILRSFFARMLDTTDTGRRTKEGDDPPWFQDAWVQILDFAFDAASQDSGRDTLDIRCVGVELLVVCCQLASKCGMKASLTPARVSTSMEVVNGALKTVRETKTAERDAYRRSHSTVTEISRQNLFLEAFEGLESYEEFLNKSKTDDDSDLQVLHKFSENLARLYECCKVDELAVDKKLEYMRLFVKSAGDEDRIAHDEALEKRFVRIVGTVMKKAYRNPKARFLNQPQRSSLELLESMATNGSFEAFRELISASGMSLFTRMESERDGSDSSETEESAALDLINFECSSIVSKAVLKDGVSDECRVFVLYQVLSCFAAGSDLDVKLPRRKVYYKRAVPIIIQGLQSTSRMDKKIASSSADAAICQIVDAVWGKFCACLSAMLAPVPIGKELLKIPRIAELLLIIEAAKESVVYRHTSNLCAILSFGASKAFEVAKLHDAFVKTNAESDMGKKSRKHRDELLELFIACFSGVCALQPEDEVLSSVAKEVLSYALTEFSSDEPAHSSISETAGELVCRAMQQNDKMETLVISVFPTLCKLVVSDSVKLRDAVGKVFIAVDVSNVLLTAQTRYTDAERRAEEAEEKVKTLSATVENLQRRNKTLSQEVAALEAATAL